MGFTMNQWLTPDSVLWVAAVVSLALLALSGPVAEIMLSPRRDGGMRAAKVALYLCISLVVLLPCLVLLTGETVTGTPCGLYLVFFSIFCYYTGKRIGAENGRRSISDLMGLGSAKSMEEAQDRLFESRLRLPSRNEVVESIAVLSSGSKTGVVKAALGPAAAGKGRAPQVDEDEITDVAVEGLEERIPHNRKRIHPRQ